MKRLILAVVSGLVCWILVASLLNFLPRWLLAGYATAEPTMNFTLSMQLGRLLIGALSSLAAGWLCGRIAGADRRAATVLGVLLLLLFIPEHAYLWKHFPVWYHAVFLVTLLPLVLAGSRLGRQGSSAARD